MDAKVICQGAIIYFLVREKGAMLGLGDVHAGMGDGEAVICGVETTAEVKIRVEVIHSPKIRPQRPLVEFNNRFITIGHGPSLDEAASIALNDILEFIHKKTKITPSEIAMLISAVGDLKVCQIVDPQKTARVEMPKSILEFPDQPILP
jgi:amidase